MAKINTQVIAINLSTIVKNDMLGKNVITEELLTTVEALVQEIVGDSVVVEVREVVPE